MTEAVVEAVRLEIGKLHMEPDDKLILRTTWSKPEIHAEIADMIWEWFQIQALVLGPEVTDVSVLKAAS